MLVTVRALITLYVNLLCFYFLVFGFFGMFSPPVCELFESKTVSFIIVYITAWYIDAEEIFLSE